MIERNKQLGVLGGMGSKASAYFNNLIVDMTQVSRDQDHIDVVYLNCASMPDRTEAILNGKDKVLRTLLIEKVRLLEELGCSHIAIPCNTSHYFLTEMQDSVSIPIINMVKETLDFIVGKDKYSGEKIRVGLLATDGTVNTGVYEKYLDDSIFEMQYPTRKMQRKIMEVIYDGVKEGARVSFNDLDEVIMEFKDMDCNYAILGCTELSVLYGKRKSSFIVDSLYVLARKSILFAGKEIKH
jgi:aspartate racemase